MKKTLTALALLLGLTEMGFAASAIATHAVNVRAGPSVAYLIVDTLYAGEAVTLTQCEQNWCHILHNGPDGWVSANYLQLVDRRIIRRYQDPCDFDATTAFHMDFGLYYTPLAKYCRERDD